MTKVRKKTLVLASFLYSVSRAERMVRLGAYRELFSSCLSY